MFYNFFKKETDREEMNRCNKVVIYDLWPYMTAQPSMTFSRSAPFRLRYLSALEKTTIRWVAKWVECGWRNGWNDVTLHHAVPFMVTFSFQIVSVQEQQPAFL